MSHPNLTGTVTGVNRLDAARVNVTVEIEDPTVPEENRVEGSAQTLTVPMPIEKVKTMGIGAKVELTLKKVSVKKKAAEGAQASEGAPADDTVGDEGQENDDPEPTKAAAPAPAAGRRRAASAPAA